PSSAQPRPEDQAAEGPQGRVAPSPARATLAAPQARLVAPSRSTATGDRASPRASSRPPSLPRPERRASRPLRAAPRLDSASRPPWGAPARATGRTEGPGLRPALRRPSPRPADVGDPRRASGGGSGGTGGGHRALRGRRGRPRGATGTAAPP